MTNNRHPSSEELERWLHAPEVWTTLPPEHLRQRLATRLARCGTRNDGGRLRLLKRLDKPAVARAVYGAFPANAADGSFRRLAMGTE